VHGYLRSQTPDADDVLSEVFVRVARALSRFDGNDAALRRWVFTIAHNCLVDDQRRRTRRRRLQQRTPIAGSVDAPADPFDPALAAALGGLTPDQREVVTLRFIADLSIEDVAEVTGRPLGAVKSLQHRALHNLGVALGTGAASAWPESPA
jgi:RNA polymerase sigma-70 factor (ECF subfamily)